MQCKYFINKVTNAGTTTIYCQKGNHEMTNTQAEKVTKMFCTGECEKCMYYNKENSRQTSDGSELAFAADKNEISEDYKLAVATHQHICECGKTAAAMIVEIGKSLKKMRDGKLYIILGYASFKDYIENNGDYSFKERQAYTYIKLYEDNSTKFLEDNAELGVTKLSLLNKIAGYERQEFVEEHDLAGMTVEEIEKLIKEHQKQGEQLSLFEKESAEKDKAFSESEAEKAKLEAKIEELYAEISELREKPIDVAVRELTEDELREIEEKNRSELKKEFEKKAKADIKKASEKTASEMNKLKEDIEKVSAELEKAKSAEESMRNEVHRLMKIHQQEKAEAEKQKQALENKLKSGSPDEAKTALKIYFQEIQKNVDRFIEMLHSLPNEERNKFAVNTAKWFEKIIEELETNND